MRRRLRRRKSIGRPSQWQWKRRLLRNTNKVLHLCICVACMVKKYNFFHTVRQGKAHRSKGFNGHHLVQSGCEPCESADWLSPRHAWPLLWYVAVMFLYFCPSPTTPLTMDLYICCVISHVMQMWSFWFIIFKISGFFYIIFWFLGTN